MKRLAIIILLLFLMLTLHNTATVPAGDLSCNTGDDTTFNPVAGFAAFDYEIYRSTTGLHTGQYAYSYSISDLESGIDISCFLQETTEHTSIGPAFCDFMAGNANPACWTVQSTETLFHNTIEHGESATALQFSGNNMTALSNAWLDMSSEQSSFINCKFTYTNYDYYVGNLETNNTWMQKAYFSKCAESR